MIRLSKKAIILFTIILFSFSEFSFAFSPFSNIENDPFDPQFRYDPEKANDYITKNENGYQLIVEIKTDALGKEFRYDCEDINLCRAIYTGFVSNYNYQADRIVTLHHFRVVATKTLNNDIDFIEMVMKNIFIEFNEQVKNTYKNFSKERQKSIDQLNVLADESIL